MKRLFAIISLASTLSIPVYAQGISDTAYGGDNSSEEIKVTPSEELAFAPEYSPQGADMAIGIASPVGGAQLALSDEQLEKIAKVKASLADATGPKKLQLKTLHRQLKDALTKENVDKSSVLNLQSQINSLRDELSNAKLNARLDTLAVLTPEQKAKLRHAALQRQALGSMGGRMGGKHHRGHGGQPGFKGGHHGRGPGAAAPNDDKAMEAPNSDSAV